MTILAPSKKANKKRGRQHKTRVDRTIIAMRVITRWLKRSFVLIGDGGFVCVRLGHACIKQHVTLVSRLRLDAALYDFAPSPAKGQRGQHREKGARFTALTKLAADTMQRWRDACIDWYGNEKKTSAYYLALIFGIQRAKNLYLFARYSLPILIPIKQKHFLAPICN